MRRSIEPSLSSLLLPAEEPVALTSELLPPEPSECVGEAGVPFGLALAPLAPPLECAPLLLHREPARCARCEGFVSMYCETSHDSWTCAICGERNRSPAPASDPDAHPELGGAASHEAELGAPVVDYVLRAAPAPAAPPGVVFFLVDDTSGPAALADLLAAARASVPLLPPATLLGLVAFGRCASVYLLGQPAAAEAEGADAVEALAFGALEPPSERERATLRRTAHLALAPRQACEARLYAALEALQPPAPRAGRAAAGAAPPRGPEPTRALLPALGLVLELLGSAGGRDASSLCGELVIALAGAPNYGVAALPSPPVGDGGDGGGAPPLPPLTPLRASAVAALRDCGRRLARAGLGTFLACSPPHAAAADSGGGGGGGHPARPRGWFDVEALRSLCLPTAGSVHLERSPGTTDSVARLTRNLSALLGGSAHRGCRGALSIFCPEGMHVGQVVGAATGFEDCDAAEGGPAAAAACHLGVLRHDSTVCVRLFLHAPLSAALPPRGGGPGGARRAVIQAALRYVSCTGETRLRTLTVCAPLAQPADPPRARGAPTEAAADARPDWADGWLGSVRPGPTGLLACRLLALAACAEERDSREAAASEAVADAAASSWLESCAVPQVEVSRGWLWNSSTTVGYRLPSEGPSTPSPAGGALEALLRTSYALRRSPAAAAAHLRRDCDAAQAARLALLTRPAGCASRLAAPRLFAVDAAAGVGRGHALRELAAVDLMMHRSASLVLDTGDELLLWRGAEAARAADEAEAEALLAAAREAASARCPVARVATSHEGGEGEGRLATRLAPSRRDPPALGEEMLSALLGLTLGTAAEARPPPPPPPPPPQRSQHARPPPPSQPASHSHAQALLERLGLPAEPSFREWSSEVGLLNEARPGAVIRA